MPKVLHKARIGTLVATTLSAAGLIAIAVHEDYRAQPYQDSAQVWTDGFGNTHGVQPQHPVTVTQALVQLQKNASVAGQAIDRCVTVPLTQHQYDALLSFTFNVGGNAFCQSTLVRRLNAGDYQGACDELPRWVYANGKKLPGLVKRRAAERDMCLGQT